MESTMANWKKNARKIQESLYNCLGNRVWDEIETQYLKERVGFGLFGCPRNNADYDDLQSNIINKICNKILSLHSGNNIKIAFIYVIYRLKGENGGEGIEVLVKLHEEKTGNDLFIDPYCRVYRGWEDYLESNKLPKCDLCYPVKGKYSFNDGIVDIKFVKSHACDTISNILTGLDITSKVATVAAAGLTIASYAYNIPTKYVRAAVGTLTVSGTYDVGRSAYKLYDIKKHCGSLGLRNPDSRREWLNITGSVVGIASMGTTVIAKDLVTAGTALGQNTLTALRVLNLSSLAISGIGVLTGLITVVLKLLDGTLNSQDVKDFTQVCFFFLNAIISQNIANRLISDIAECDLENLFCLAKNTTHCYTRKMLEFKDTSNYELLKNLLIGCQIRLDLNIDFRTTEENCFEIIHLIHNLTSEQVDWERFVFQVTNLLLRIWTKYKDTMLDALDEVAEVLKLKDWNSGFLCHRNELPHMSPDCAQQILITTKQTAMRCSNSFLDSNEKEKQIATLGNEFNKIQPCSNEMEYINRFKYICQYLIQQYNLVKEQYESALDSKSSNDGFNHTDFDKSYGIDGKRHDFFFKEATKTLNTKNILEELLRYYYIDIAVGKVPPPKELLSMDCSVSSLYTFCGPIGKFEFTDSDYFDKVRDLTLIDVNPSNSKLLRKGDLAFIQPSPNQPFKGMFIYTIYLKDFLIGQLLVLKKNTEHSC